MDFLQKFDTVTNSETGATLHFKSPEDGKLAYLDKEKTKPLTVKMLGASSAAHQAHAVKSLREMRGAEKQDKDDNGYPDSFFSDTAERQAKRLSAVIVEWTGFTKDGKEVECTKENVFDVMVKYQELRVQAINFLDNTANFIKS